LGIFYRDRAAAVNDQRPIPAEKGFEAVPGGGTRW
jgi:hypothetical protein